MAESEIAPRMLREDAAARYVGFKGPRGAWREWRARHDIQPMPGCSIKLYDRRQIDAAIDRAFGIAVNTGEAPIGRAKWG